MLRYIFLCFILFLSNAGIATESFVIDDDLLDYRKTVSKGRTVDVPVSRYYPANRNSALYKVLKQAQILTANVSFVSGNDGIPYKQHDWSQSSDRANLRKGIDCSRAIWFAFTRAGLSYNNSNSYLTTAGMWRKTSNMKHNFNSCSINKLDDLRLGDVLIYRSGSAGHTVMVLDPKKELAWGSHGWDQITKRGIGTGVEVQKVLPADWKHWDKYNMKLKACWRYQDFSKKPPILTALVDYLAGKRYLNNSDLEDKTRYILWIMRNEMFARHGYRFGNNKLSDYFRRQSWYKAKNISSRTIFRYRFSKLERANVKFIAKYEKAKIAGNSIHQPVGDYPETSTRRLTYSDIRGKSKQELRIMRNEIYARHGYTFKGNLLAHFRRNSWYNPTTRASANLYNNHFSQIERDNVNFIKQYE